MIKKKSGSVQVDKLRFILLMEADFNFNNKLLGKHSLQRAEDLHLLPQEQYGSWKGHSSAIQALKKRLAYVLLRQHRMSGAICSNDALMCYDRIAHNIGSLALQRIGTPKPPIISMFSTLQHMKHQVRTQWGDSTNTYNASATYLPIHGIGHGNGIGPALWAIMNSPLIDALRKERYGLQMTNPISKDNNLVAGFGFVDDMDLIVSRSLTSSIEENSDTLQQALNLWECGLKCTGRYRPRKNLLVPHIIHLDQRTMVLHPPI